MKNQFAPYELALKLKELGFNEHCFTSYTNEGKLSSLWNINIEDYGIDPYEPFFDNIGEALFSKNDRMGHGYIAAPLWQQAFDWFREQHSLYTDIYRTRQYFSANIECLEFKSTQEDICKNVSYEIACQESLNKLIEIVNNRIKK